MEETNNEKQHPFILIFLASRLAGLPLHCAHVQYPNKMNQVLENETELLPPSGRILLDRLSHMI